MATDTKAKAVTPVEEFFSSLESMTKQFEMVLPEHIPVEKFKRTIRTAMQMDAKLLEANRHSLYGACMRAAQDGLLLDGREATLVVFNTNVGTKQQPKYEKMVQYMPMMGGILKKVRNSGELASIAAYVVYEKDKFTFWVDEDGEHLKHEPTFASDRGKITHAYMLARTKDGGKYFEIMTRAELDQVRNCSRAKDSGPWKDWEAEMFKKTVIRRGSKRLPMSSDLDEVIRRDDEMFDLDKSAAEEPEPSDAKPSRLGKIIAEQMPEQPKLEQPKVEPPKKVETPPPAQKAPAPAPKSAQAEEMENDAQEDIPI